MMFGLVEFDANLRTLNKHRDVTKAIFAECGKLNRFL
jgi:hypothetical protein